jgi:hypothetical protein
MSISSDRFNTLKDLRPVTTIDEAWHGTDRDADLRQIMTGEDAELANGPAPAVQPRPPRLRRRLVLAGVGAVILAGAAAAVPVIGASPSYAATPPLLHFVPVAGQQSAGSVLTELAGRAATQPSPPGQGRYQYVHTKGWYLHESADVDKGVFDSGIAEIDRQLWLTTDGSGRLLRSTRNDSPPMINPDMTLAAGAFDGNVLSADATDAAVRAKYGHPATAAGWTHTIEEIWNRQVVPPALHARLLRALAGQPGLSLRGDTIDRVGRHGVAVSVDDQRLPRERLVLVFDPDTATLLDTETVVLDNSDLPVQAPATIAYTVWITTGYATSTTSQP